MIFDGSLDDSEEEESSLTAMDSASQHEPAVLSANDSQMDLSDAEDEEALQDSSVLSDEIPMVTGSPVVPPKSLPSFNAPTAATSIAFTSLDVKAAYPELELAVPTTNGSSAEAKEKYDSAIASLFDLKYEGPEVSHFPQADTPEVAAILSRMDSAKMSDREMAEFPEVVKGGEEKVRQSINQSINALTGWSTDDSIVHSFNQSISSKLFNVFWFDFVIF
jgi:hypothetical protein